jgi:anti-sigma B factor antagonist
MSFEVAKSEDAIYVRVHGLGSMKTAPTLEAFVHSEAERGASQLVIDLADCTGVDSTFMGTLLGVSHRMSVALINVDDHARKQLSSVGLDSFLTLVKGESPLPSRLKLTKLSTQIVSDRERMKLMVRAHKELVAADERNKAKFGAFLEAIVAELE